MTDTTSTHQGNARAGGAAWALPLLALAPAAAIRQFTDHSTPWLAISWAFCALSAALLAAGWVTTLRHGVRSGGAWIMCTLSHVVLAAHIIRLVRN
ncbi:hypothetical protein OG389_20060 [Streptomyces sp. NBC_00435]|uniref:hypothetical protein n=1 Tax=Streptomyces sp. NBC_00435 TaxID=2903649 RepID=UPI002E227C74